MRLLFVVAVAVAALVVAVVEDSVVHATFAEVGSTDAVPQLTDLVFSLQVQNKQLLERLDALETTVTSITENMKGAVDKVNTLAVEVDFHDSLIEELNSNDAMQNERIDALEASTTEPFVSCESAPCENGATCVDVNVDTFVCLCRDGFFGITCSESYSDTTFLATFDVYTLMPSNPIVFNYALYNSGGHYDPNTGTYTVPLDGIYEFTVHIWSYNDATVAAWLVVDGTNAAYAYEQNQDSPYEGISLLVVLELEAGQQVWVSPNQINGMYQVSTFDGLLSWFSGHLLYAL